MNLDDALQPLLARLRASYATSPLPGFFAWWGAELRACMPARWRNLLQDHVETLLLNNSEDSLDIYYASSPGQPPVARIPRRLSQEEQRIAIQDARSALDDPRVRMRLCLPRQRVLLRTLQLPAAAEHNLRQVLGFEMDRQTPFKVDQVYLDHRISARDSETRRLTVDLAVVPRPALDAELKQLEPLELALDGIDGWSGEPGSERLGFNFLPPAGRVKRRNKRMLINLGLGAAALVLLLLAMSLWVSNREQALADMQAEVARVQKQASQVATLRKGLSESIKGASFLMRKKNETPVRIELLRALTHTLGDDTYLQRLSIDDNNRLSLQGQSDHAASLLEKVSRIPHLSDASFQGVIQPDARSGKERFNIMATVTATPAPADKPATKKAREGADAAAETSS
ncbi:MAG: PilN domain-containing protein [Rhodanobacteraceae bacterium]